MWHIHRLFRYGASTALAVFLAGSLSATGYSSEDVEVCEEVSQKGRQQLASALGFHPDLDTSDEVEAAVGDALQIFEQASRLCLKASEKAREPAVAARLAALGYLNAGAIFEEQQRWPEARSSYASGIEMIKGLDGDRSLALPELYEKLSDQLGRAGEYEEALRYLEEALAIRQEAFGENDPQLIRTLVLLGSFYSPRGINPEERAAVEATGLDETKLERYLRRAVDIALEGQATREQIGEALDTLGGFLSLQRRYTEAEEIRQLKLQLLSAVSELAPPQPPT